MPRNVLTSLLRHLRATALMRDGGGQTDAQLLRRFIDFHDETAFEAIVRLHAPMVLGVCQRLLRNTHDVEDAFQVTFLVLVRKAASLSKRDLVGNWLYGVARRTALKTRALSQKRQLMEKQMAVLPEPKPRETHAVWEDIRPVIDAALECLPRQYRSVVVLCDLENKSHQETARQIGCPVGTVSSRLARGRALLAKQLARHGVTLSGTALAAALTQHATANWVPAKLVITTVQAATAFAAGGAAAAVVGVQVCALSRGVLKAMFLTKLKKAALILLAISTVGAGAGTILSQVNETPGTHQAEKQDANRQTDEPAVQAAERPRVDVHGDALPPDAIARLGTLRFSAQGGEHLAYSSDGLHIVVGTSRDAIVYEAATGKQLRRIGPVGDPSRNKPAVEPSVDSMSLSNDGKVLALGVNAHNNGTRLQLFDVATADFMREYQEAAQQQYLKIRFSPSNKTVAAYLFPSRAICLWDVATGKELRHWPLTGLSACFAFSPDGKTLIAGDRWMIHFWAVATGTETQCINKHPGIIYSLTLSPDGKTIASQAEAFKTEVYLWDAATGKKLFDIDGLDANETTRNPEILQFEFSPNGKTLITSRGDGVVAVWDAATGKKLRQWIALEPGKSPLLAGDFARFAFGPKGKSLALLGSGNFIRFVDPDSGKEMREHPGHRKGVRALAVSHNGRLLASADSEWLADVRLWDTTTGKEQHRFTPVDRADVKTVSGLHFSLDGRLLIALGDVYDAPRTNMHLRGRATKLRFWDTASGQEVRQVQAPVEGESFRGFHVRSPDGKIMATVLEDESVSKIILWDALTGKKLNELMRGRSTFRALGFSPDSRSVYSWSWERSVCVWDIETGKVTKEIPVPVAQGTPGAVADTAYGSFSPDGKWFTCWGDGNRGLLYDMATGKQVRRIAVPDFRAIQAFAPNQRVLAVGAENGTIDLFELASGNLRHRITEAHRAPVTSLIFTPDSRRLVSGSEDTTALVWDLTGRAGDTRKAVFSSELDGCWSDLKSDDAVRAYEAMRRLIAVPAQAMSLLSKHLQPSAAPDKRQVRLIADLASDIFATRQAATRELTLLGELAEPALRAALEKAPTPEARLRIQQLLAKIDDIGSTGEPLRQRRAVETLELIGTPQARRLLAHLATGAPEAYLTRDAKATLGRLEQIALPP
jgi:RNA polymerase sigma factor (sigma-70 family)